MASSLFGSQPRVQPPRQQKNDSSLIQKLLAVKKILAGRNPSDVIKGLIASGQMTQGQFEQLKGEARSILDSLR